MAFSLRKTSSSACVGLDIDGAFASALEIGPTGITRAASTELPADAMRDGEVFDAGAIARALREMFKQHDLPRRVMLGVANQQIVVRHLEMPVIPEERERDSAVRFQMAETVAMPLDDAVIDYQMLGDLDDGDGRPQSRVLVVAARKSMILKLL